MDTSVQLRQRMSIYLRKFLPISSLCVLIIKDFENWRGTTLNPLGRFQNEIHAIEIKIPRYKVNKHKKFKIATVIGKLLKPSG